MYRPTGAHIEKLDAVEAKLINFQVRRGRLPFGSGSPVEISIYRRLFQALASISQSPLRAPQRKRSKLS